VPEQYGCGEGIAVAQSVCTESTVPQVAVAAMQVPSWRRIRAAPAAAHEYVVG
jgi:hypothetical protein